MERLLTPPDPPLASQGFRLRPFTVDDAEAIKAAGEDADIMRYTLMPAAPTDEATVQWLTRAIEGWQHGMARFALVPAAARDDRCAGQIGLVLTEHPAGNAEAFYWLLPEVRGSAWAAAALRLVSEWAFESLDVERVGLIVDLDNLASQRTAEKAGFTREGVLRGYLPAPRRGRVDVWSFSRLASD